MPQLPTVDEAIEQVFLSPRVVDRAAFDDFAAALRQLIERAAQNGRTLQTAAAQAEGVLKTFGQAGPLVESKLTATAGALATVEARVGEVQTLLNRAIARAEQVEVLEARLDRLMDEKVASFAARVATVVQDGIARLEATRAGIHADAAAKAEESARIGAQVHHAAAGLIEATDARIGELKASALTQVADRTEQAARAVDGLRDAMTGLVEAAEARVAAAATSAGERLDTAGTEAAERAAKLHAATGQALDAAERRLSDLLAEAERRMDPLRNGLAEGAADVESRLQRLASQFAALRGPGLEALTALCTRAATLLGQDPATGAPIGAGSSGPEGSGSPGSLAALVSRGEHLRHETEAATRELATIGSQAQLARRILGESLLEATTLIDRLTERHDRLRDELGASIAKCDEAARRIGSVPASGPLAKPSLPKADVRPTATPAVKAPAPTPTGNAGARPRATSKRTPPRAA